jgi:hypothetical protein
MRARGFFSFVVAVVAGVTLVSASGAATKTSQLGRIDVSSRAAVIHYLRSIHIDPAGVVIQRDAHNYAGANCPGKHWNCTTTTHAVVQIAPAAGRNTFSCSTVHCAVVQFAPAAPVNNTASCVRTAGRTQSCSVTQLNSSGGDNTAIVYEKAVASDGLAQTTKSTATITQRSTSGSNTACVYQETVLSDSTSLPGHVTLNQESHQSVTVTQDSTTGDNSADSSAFASGACDTADPITQNQTLTSTDTSPGAITQSQNAGNHGANVTIDIEQNQGVANGVASGTNDANFVQNSTLTAIANSSNGPVSQTQSSVDGGLLGTVNQDSSGGSTANTEQHEKQCEDAATAGLASCHESDPDASEAPASLTQNQIGPIRKGLGTATQTRGGSADTFTIDQTSQQDNDQGSGSNQTEDIEADCLTDGNCTVTQSVTVNGEETDNFAEGGDVNATITCTGSECVTSPGE